MRKAFGALRGRRAESLHGFLDEICSTAPSHKALLTLYTSGKIFTVGIGTMLKHGLRESGTTRKNVSSSA